MIPIIHKVNSIEKLNNVPDDYGVEIDIRNNSGELVLSHDLHESTTTLKEFLNNYDKKLLIANIKESGIENISIDMIKDKNIENFFLLDVEFPYIYQNYSQQKKYLSTRFSAYESIESVARLVNKVTWLWIDTYSDFELDEKTADVVKNFKTCLVSPSRWGQTEMLQNYLNKFKNQNIDLDAIMIEKNENI